jgi:ribA/ribD-fused uncharacterized protein
VNVDPIVSFTGPHEFLSNFYDCEFEWRGMRWWSSEQAFQYMKVWYASKADANKYIPLFCEPNLPPGLAKHYGREIVIDATEWNKHRVDYMREIVHAKFARVPGLAGKLINTGAAMLVEGNNHGDRFWGRVNGNGKNVLGAILMEVRGYWLWGTSS